MSKDNPGVVFDASNSWNGFNHQGRLAILFSIKKILEVFEMPISKEEKTSLLEQLFLEVEYLEDFSIGRVTDDDCEYYYVHQVKDHAAELASNYDSAFLGLVDHIEKMPNIKNAYLHVTRNIDFNGGSVHDYIKYLVLRPDYLTDILDNIQNVRSNDELKKKLFEKKKGRRGTFEAKLRKALLEKDNTQKDLDENNIDDALEALEEDTNNQIRALSLLTDDKLNKIDLYNYDIDGHLQSYCGVDQVEDLIKNEIKKSIDVIGLNKMWESDNFVEKRYMYLMTKLDEHIIDRNLNYSLYMNEKKDRKIRLSKVYDWLTCNNIDTADKEYFHFNLKELFSKIANKYCEKCKSKNCDSCYLSSAVNKILQMTTAQLCEFLSLTCPNNCEEVSVKTFSMFLSERKICNPFFKGIKDIKIPFEEDKQAITYIDQQTLQYILTMIEIDNEDYEGTKDICTEIVKNRSIYELLMDYNCFISRNMNCSSILDEAQKLGNVPSEDVEHREKDKEHIAHLRDVRVITLDEFITENN